MTAPRNRAGQFAKVTPADAVLDAACKDAVGTFRTARRAKATVPLVTIARALQLAAEEAAMLDDGGAR